MVTQLKQNERSSKSNDKAGKEPNEQAQLSSRAKERVDNAVKARTESFVSLREAAASALLLGIQYGRFEQFNRLFNALPVIDADALRQKFIPRVIDTYGVDGIRDPSDENRWLKRPTPFIAYTANPPENEKGQHFRLAKANDSETDAKRRDIIKRSKEAVIAAGEEGLEQIVWLKRDEMLNAPSIYDINSFKKSIGRELLKAAKAVNDPETQISAAIVRSVARAMGFTKGEMASIELALVSAPSASLTAAGATPQSLATAIDADTPSTEVPEDHPSRVAA